jgi:hypothetical protein
MKHRALPCALVAALSLLGGCGANAHTDAPTPLGRSFAAGPSGTIGKAVTPIGDPPPERNGVLPADTVTRQNAPSWTARSPQAALLHYALLYINWNAVALPSREHELSSLAVGSARLITEQLAATHNLAATLIADHVHNSGLVLSIAPGQGIARGHWIIVTQEQTTGVGPYAALPPTLHVTFANVEQLNHRWTISEWRPRD